MTVSELIVLLEKAPPEDIVFVHVGKDRYEEVSAVVSGDGAIKGITHLDTGSWKISPFGFLFRKGVPW